MSLSLFSSACLSLAVMFAAVPIFLPFMRRIRLDPSSSGASSAERSPAPALEEGGV